MCLQFSLFNAGTTNTHCLLAPWHQHAKPLYAASAGLSVSLMIRFPNVKLASNEVFNISRSGLRWEGFKVQTLLLLLLLLRATEVAAGGTASSCCFCSQRLYQAVSQSVMYLHSLIQGHAATSHHGNLCRWLWTSQLLQKSLRPLIWQW